MNEVKIGDAKKNILFKQTEDPTIIQLNINDFDNNIKMLMTREQLIVALKFITTEENDVKPTE